MGQLISMHERNKYRRVPQQHLHMLYLVSLSNPGVPHALVVEYFYRKWADMQSSDAPSEPPRPSA